MSCDTFVALPPATDGCIVFGKNSDRPATEVQELVHVPAGDHGNTNVQCTYIEIPQASHTHAVVLSKPAWMWGAEMGANEHGLCIGNEAIWTKLGSEADQQEKLLGMDLVRLGLERATSAGDAVTVITNLLAAHGQGGPVYDDVNKMDVVYHNSFILADSTEAWVLETAGTEWVARRVTEGVCNLSNLVTIGCDYQRHSPSLHTTAREAGLWQDGQLNFSQVYGSTPPEGMSCPGAESPTNRYTAGRKLMEQVPEKSFDVRAMMSILRNDEAGICRLGHVGSATMSSQVSVIYPTGGKPSVHWLTGTPNPARSVFKPFIFTSACSTPAVTRAPVYSEDPARVKPRFQRDVDRRHALYKAQETICPLDEEFEHESLYAVLRDMETACITDVEKFVLDHDADPDGELDDLFKDIVESEMKFYPKSIKLN